MDGFVWAAWQFETSFEGKVAHEAFDRSHRDDAVLLVAAAIFFAAMGADPACRGRKGIGLDDQFPSPFAGLVVAKPELGPLIEQRYHTANICPGEASGLARARLLDGMGAQGRDTTARRCATPGHQRLNAFFFSE
jgi:acetylornithine deacetylase/succinyl-diaminopimelate desuccinylase-like protein